MDWIYPIIAVVAVSLISLIGIMFLVLKTEKLKKILIYFISFSAGALLADAFIHLLPEAVEEYGFGLNISLYILAGIAFSFIIEKFIHWNHCHLPITKDHKHPFAIMNLVGDAIHNFIDGMIIAASFFISPAVGIATTIAVLLHEIPQEIADFGVLVHGGFTKAKALMFNLLTGLTAVLGAILVLLLGYLNEGLVMFLVPFTVGTFIYIAATDLIPELHKEVKLSVSIPQLIFFLIGIGIMMLLLLLE